jgi:hypothetical protein
MECTKSNDLPEHSLRNLETAVAGMVSARRNTNLSATCHLQKQTKSSRHTISCRSPTLVNVQLCVCSRWHHNRRPRTLALEAAHARFVQDADGGLHLCVNGGGISLEKTEFWLYDSWQSHGSRISRKGRRASFAKQFASVKWRPP